MKETAQRLVASSKGILAADESTKTITKMFEAINLTSTPELNKKYRKMLFTAVGIEEFISGVILYNETIRQGLGKILEGKAIIPGIKVDEGLEPFGEGEEEATKGLEGLPERLKEYLEMGAKFTKWRGVFRISDTTPTDSFLEENLGRMVKFAKISQEVGLVPIVEPEILLDGNHTTTRCEEIETKVLKLLFEKLVAEGVDLSSLILKTSMVLPGKDNGVKAAPLEVAKVTVRTLKNSVPSGIAGVVFLSGGQSPNEATDNLNEIEKNLDGISFPLSFSFGRALQEEALNSWKGFDENIKIAQEVFINRARKVFFARKGELT
ncbi:MAG: fructose-bisphosphate aldolase class I [Candidatus Woesebacteria bacterium]|nr:fructose-bisphosphate aldolase class I [Candidatus Woesebacteria bacterium]